MKLTGLIFRKLAFALLGLLIPVFPLFAQYCLDIEIEGLRNDNGKLMIQLFDGDQKVVRQDTCTIYDQHCSVIFSGLMPGRYAVRYYHDENANMTMEINLVGKPMEGYGFSNNVTGKFGPPPFEKWLFTLDSDKKIILKPTY
jgi:uncharacterized protein (DUF2141 family)